MHGSRNNFMTNSHSISSSKMGSYRVSNYDAQKMPYDMEKMFPTWKDGLPLTISCRQEAMHIHPIELRVEDYNSIRSQKLESRHQRALDTVISRKSFNRELLNGKGVRELQVMPYSQEDTLRIDDIDRLSRGYKNYSPGNYGGSSYGGNNNGYSGSGNNNGYSGSNNNYSGNNNNSNHSNHGGNPFMSNSTNSFPVNNNNGYNTRSSSNNPFGGSSSNPFANNSVNNNNRSVGSTNNAYPFNNNNSNNTGNPFTNNNNNNNNSNPFGANKNNNSNPFGGNTDNRNQYGTNSNSNPFTGNNSNNNNNNSNPFSSNNRTNYSNNNSNPFNKNNNNNNPFSNNSNNNNNRNDSNNNNPFGNNNNPFNNNNYSNNNNNNSNRSNLFNGNNNNSYGNNGNSNYGNDNMGNMQMMILMQMQQLLVEQLKNNNKSRDNDTGDDSNWQSLRNQTLGAGNWNEGPRNEYDDYFKKEFGEYLNSPRNKKTKTIILNKVSDSAFMGNSMQFLPRNNSMHSQYINNVNNRSGIMDAGNSSFTLNNSNRSFNPSSAIKQTSSIDYDTRQCTFNYRLAVIWDESKEFNEDPVCYVEGSLTLEEEPSTLELQKMILEEVIRINRQIRADASILLEMPKMTSRNSFTVQGTLIQRKINLPKGYNYLPSQFQGFSVNNLIISNQYGQIMFPGTVDVEGIDFSTCVEIKPFSFDLNNDYLGERAMIVTVNSIYPKWEKLLSAGQQAVEAKLRKHLTKIQAVHPDKICKLLNFDSVSKSYMYSMDVRDKRNQ